MTYSIKVYKVLQEISIDIGSTTFTLHPGDHFEFNGEYIETLHYSIKIPWRNNEISEGSLSLNRNKLRTFSSIRSIRIGGNTSWTPISRCVGKEIEDITLQYNRNKLLNQLL